MKFYRLDYSQPAADIFSMHFSHCVRSKHDSQMSAITFSRGSEIMRIVLPLLPINHDRACWTRLDFEGDDIGIM